MALFVETSLVSRHCELIIKKTKFREFAEKSFFVFCSRYSFERSMVNFFFSSEWRLRVLLMFSIFSLSSALARQIRKAANARIQTTVSKRGSPGGWWLPDSEKNRIKTRRMMEANEFWWRFGIWQFLDWT